MMRSLRRESLPASADLESDHGADFHDLRELCSGVPVFQCSDELPADSRFGRDFGLCQVQPDSELLDARADLRRVFQNLFIEHRISLGQECNRTLTLAFLGTILNLRHPDFVALQPSPWLELNLYCK